MKYNYDAFICHTSEDKDTFVRKLAEELTTIGLNIWYDEFTITIGDSLFKKINEGLIQSKYGIVIFSKAFFEKRWPRKELEGLAALEEDGHKKILPIWLNVKREDILQHYPILADLFAADASMGLNNVVRELLRVLIPGKTTNDNHISPTVNTIKSEVYCTRCGAKAGESSTCTGINIYHDFKSYSGNVFCTRCGAKAGESSTCTGINIYHDFKSYH